ncbi:MAG: hypothetical protein M3Z75_16415 [Actinomycetota bacterium]|nr:hypothetical protein [Actinomycetota bacterium]
MIEEDAQARAAQKPWTPAAQKPRTLGAPEPWTPAAQEPRTLGDTEPETPVAPRRPRRRRRRRPVMAGAIVTVLVLVAGLAVIISLRSHKTPGTLLAYPAGCPRSPMDEVPNAESYRLKVACARIAGTVVAYRLNRAYDDLELTVVPGRAYSSALSPANHGRFEVDIPGPDLGAVKSPDLNGSGIFYGSWVENKATHHLTLMPTWRITTSPGGGLNPDTLLFSLAAARHAGQRFSLSARIPATLPQGAGPAIPVTASWLVPASRKTHRAVTVPASQVRVLAEITGPSGDPVVWKAAQTGTLGLVTIRLPLFVATGRYTCHLYAIAAGRVVSITQSFRVGKT